MDHKISSAEFEDILVYFSTSMHSSNTEDELLWDLVKNCISKLNFEDTVVYLLDDENQQLVQKAVYGPKNPDGNTILNAINIPVGRGVTGTVAQTGKALIVNDTSQFKDYIVDDKRRYSEIAVPMIVDNKIIGVIDSEHSEKNYFTPQHLKILSAIAAVSASQISRMRYLQKAREEEIMHLKAKRQLAEFQVTAISSQLNPHFIFNSLNAIQHFILKDHKKLAFVYFSIFGKLIRYFLQNIHKDQVFLLEEIKMLEWYLRLQKLRYEENFSYELEISPSAYNEEARIPSIILQSLIENILELMISQSQGNNNLKAVFSVDADRVSVKVTISEKRGGVFTDHQPEYKKNINQWEEHFNLLNEIYNYKMEKSLVNQYNPSGDLSGKVFQIVFPNLTKL